MNESIHCALGIPFLFNRINQPWRHRVQIGEPYSPSRFFSLRFSFPMPPPPHTHTPTHTHTHSHSSYLVTFAMPLEGKHRTQFIKYSTSIKFLGKNTYVSKHLPRSIYLFSTNLFRVSTGMPNPIPHRRSDPRDRTRTPWLSLSSVSKRPNRIRNSQVPCSEFLWWLLCEVEALLFATKSFLHCRSRTDPVVHRSTPKEIERRRSKETGDEERS